MEVMIKTVRMNTNDISSTVMREATNKYLATTEKVIQAVKMCGVAIKKKVTIKRKSTSTRSCKHSQSAG
jgi:hypothetical protein